MNDALNLFDVVYIVPHLEGALSTIFFFPLSQNVKIEIKREQQQQH